MKLPNKKYKIIYADPPWDYKDKAIGRGGALDQYPTTDTKTLGQIPIKELADDDCALFMWVTMPKLNECFQLIEDWGFNYKTAAFVWIKTNKKNGGTFMGLGRWTRANAELCLLATKGKPKRMSASVHQVIHSPLRRHSQKPDETRDRIVQLMGNLPRIELFARNTTDGWDVWGNDPAIQ